MRKREMRLHNGRTGAAFAIRLAAESSENSIQEVMTDGTIKVCLKVSPNSVDANPVLINFMAAILMVKPERIEIVAGLTGNDKLVSVMDIDPQTAQKRILRHIE